MPLCGTRELENREQEITVLVLTDYHPVYEMNLCEIGVQTPTADGEFSSCIMVIIEQEVCKQI
jgi:hypothetical protein